MGNRNKGGKEAKKPKKAAKPAKASAAIATPITVEVIRKKRKGEGSGQD